LFLRQKIKLRQLLHQLLLALNSFIAYRHELIWNWLTIAAISFGISSSASGYEVDGKVSEAITTHDGGVVHATASFTVFVRDCGWLIQTIETNEIGVITRRDVGSTNGTEIYECDQILGRIQSSVEPSNTPSSGTLTFKRTSAPMLAFIVPGIIPVGEQDSAVVGHLWLMFGSQCYWPKLTTDQLRPVYDWKASEGAHGQGLKVTAVWKLLGGPGSLPRDVCYLGAWGETNGRYSISGTNFVDGTLIPTGFVFERFKVGPLNDNTFMHEMVVVKRVDVKVTAIRPGCSRASLLPSPDVQSIIVDRRFLSGIANRPPSYPNPVNGQWPTLEKSRELANVRQIVDLRNPARMKSARLQSQSGPPGNRSTVVLMVMCIFLVVPPITYFALKGPRKQ